MELIPHTQFSTDMVPEEHRFDVWRDSISVLFDIEQQKQDLKRPFDAHLDAFMLDQVMLARTRSEAAYYRRKAKDTRSDGIDMIMLQLFIKGEVEFCAGRSITQLQAGDIAVYDLSKPTNNFNTSFDNLSVLFPRELIDEYVPSATNWHGQHLPRSNPMTNLLRSHILSLYEFGPTITIEASPGLQRSLLNMTSTAFQASAENMHRSAEIVAATQLQEIKKYIRQHLADPNLTPDNIAKAFGLSRAHLYRITDPLEGIMQYIRHQRLKRCWKELQSPRQSHLSITELGFKWGYNDAGTFTRNFKKTFGMLPKDARALGALNNHQASAESQAGNDAPDRGYESWVRSLAD
ncbi:helix-turn-helix domain-containing protein [Verrucomicrobiaceae bacterium N1E253]|uniref:Helix-turn-helix domain-containing protein n=1 Tax=Oceaniferula marina TaxID=2748318 RepID=A0A851GLA3_9BACT|nr:helix-turn-helix domain-containing protein [Oceaniferula marina]NWK55530.1 helix-turn-helix domain-containing protein [Oceaniferula marina]